MGTRSSSFKVIFTLGLLYVSPSAVGQDKPSVFLGTSVTFITLQTQLQRLQYLTVFDPVLLTVLAVPSAVAQSSLG